MLLNHSTMEIIQSFDRPFLKGRRGEGQSPSSRLAEREILCGISLLPSFSLCTYMVKEKSG